MAFFLTMAAVLAAGGATIALAVSRARPPDLVRFAGIASKDPARPEINTPLRQPANSR